MSLYGGSCMTNFQSVLHGRKALLCAIIMGLSLLPLGLGERAQGSADLNRYYRAVAVLQSLDKGARQEKEVIPQEIYSQDETESLIHHPDELYVYKVVAAELAGLDQEIPRAKLFEAYARLALGQTLQGAQLLMDYVADAEEGEDRHYLLIVENLATLEDWTSVYIICLEWEEKRSECSQVRALYEWKALTELKRHETALHSLSRSESCLDWKFPVYEAMSTYSLGQKKQAKQILVESKKKFPERTRQIANLWYKMAPSKMQSLLDE